MIKKIFTLIITVTMISVINIKTFAEGEEEFSSILVLGDSISSGYGLEGYPDDIEGIRSYANLMREEFTPNTFNNLAINGQTSAQLLEKVKKGEYDENIKDADLILITIGGNDVLHNFIQSLKELIVDLDGNYQIVTSEENVLNKIKDKIIKSQNEEEYNKICENFKANFLELVTLLNEKNSDAKLYFQTIYNPFSGVTYLSEIDEFAEKYINRINEVIRNNTKDENNNILYQYADVADVFDKSAYMFTNILKFDIHPNSIGHKVIYEILSREINNTEINLGEILATIQMQTFSESEEETTAETTTISETTIVYTTKEDIETQTAEQTDSQLDNGKKSMYIGISLAIAICIIFSYVYNKLSKKTR